MRKTFSKRVIAVVLAVMMVITMVPMISITASAVDGTITTLEQLKTAAAHGGTYALGADIELTDSVTVSDYFVLDGNGHKLYAGESHTALVKVGQGVYFSVENVVFDCMNKAYCAVMTTTVDDNGSTIYLKDCTVMNSNFSATDTNGSFSAVHFSDATGVLTNCTFKGNKGSGADTGYADVFVDADASFTIYGGTYDQVYVRADGSQSGTLEIDGNAVVGDTNGPGAYSIYNAIVEGDIYVEGVKTTEAITTLEQLKTAAANGGTYALGADIEVSEQIDVAKALILYGNRKTLKAVDDVYPSMLYLANENATLAIFDATIDVNSRNTAYGILAYTGNGGNNPNNRIVLTDCTVKNAKVNSYAGAVNQFGSSQGIYTNCTFTNNQCLLKDGNNTTGADIWAGSKAKVYINGGTYDEVFIHASSSAGGQCYVSDGAVINVFNFGYGAANPSLKISDASTINTVTTWNETTSSGKLVTGRVTKDGTSTIGTTYTNVDTEKVLRERVAAGDNIRFANNIEITSQIDVKGNLVIDGNGQTLKATNNSMEAIINLANENATLTISDATIDVNSQNAYGIRAYTGNGGKNPNNEIRLTNCTVKNAKVNSEAGAVNQFGSSKGYYTNCTFTNNQCLVKDGNNTTGADIWAGSKAEVYINGGTYDEVFIHASSSAGGKCYVSGGAVIDVFNFGYGAANPILDISGASTINTVTTWNETTSSGLVTGQVINDGTSTIGTTYTNVDTEKVLRERVAAGDNIRFANNIEITSNINVAKDLRIDGNGQTLTATNGTKRIFDTVEKKVVLTFNDLTLDCNNVAEFAIHIIRETENDGTEVKLTNCTVKNSIGDSYFEGAVYLHSRATGYFENCTFEKNNITDKGQYAYASGADIWAGAATNVTINGGSYSQVFINANPYGAKGNLAVEGDAVIAELTLESDGYTATATIAPTATVTKVNVGPKEAVVTKDGKIIGTSGECATPDADDEFSNNLPASQKFTKNFELMGVQKKSDAENAIRFVSVIDADLIAAADDYGYIIGTTTKDKETAMLNAGKITLENVPHLAVSCKETDNQLSGDYGLYDADTNYKYVTAAIENITDPNKTILARVYVKCGDKTYYGDYITGTATYAGCATSLNYLVNA